MFSLISKTHFFLLILSVLFFASCFFSSDKKDSDTRTYFEIDANSIDETKYDSIQFIAIVEGDTVTLDSWVSGDEFPSQVFYPENENPPFHFQIVGYDNNSVVYASEFLIEDITQTLPEGSVITQDYINNHNPLPSYPDTTVTVGDSLILSVSEITGLTFSAWYKDSLLFSDNSTLTFLEIGLNDSGLYYLLMEDSFDNNYYSNEFQIIVAPDTNSQIITETPVVVNALSAGNLTILPLGETTVPFGGDLTITILPDTGYELESVLYDDENHISDVFYGTLNLTGLEDDLDIVFTASKKQYILTQGVNDSTAVLTKTVTHGDTVTIFTENIDNHNFLYWSVDSGKAEILNINDQSTGVILTEGDVKILANYRFLDTLPTVMFSPEAQFFKDNITIELSIDSAFPNAVIYYTLDGSTPSTGSSEYTGPLNIAETTEINAFAANSEYYRDGNNKGKIYTLNEAPIIFRTQPTTDNIYLSEYSSTVNIWGIATDDQPDLSLTGTVNGNNLPNINMGDSIWNVTVSLSKFEENYISISATDSFDVSGTSSIIVFYGDTLETPSKPVQTEAKLDSIKFEWAPKEKQVTKYYIYRSFEGTNYSLIDSVTSTQNLISYTDGGLLPTTKYYYKLRSTFSIDSMVTFSDTSEFSPVLEAETIYAYKTQYSINSYSKGVGVFFDADSGYILIGETDKNLFVRKIDLKGNQTGYYEHTGTNYETVESVKRLKDNSFLVVGNDVVVGGPWVKRLDADGQFLGETKLGMFDALVYDGDETDDGGFMIAGQDRSIFCAIKLKSDLSIDSVLTFGSENGVARSVRNLENSSNMLLAGERSDTKGRLQWIGEDMSIIAHTNLPNAYSIIDAFANSNNSGYTFLGNTTTLGKGRSDLLIGKVFNDYNLDWENPFGYTTSDDSAMAIIENKDGLMNVIGRVHNSSNFALRVFEGGQIVPLASYNPTDRIAAILQTTDGGFILYGDDNGFEVLIKTGKFFQSF